LFCKTNACLRLARETLAKLRDTKARPNFLMYLFAEGTVEDYSDV